MSRMKNRVLLVGSIPGADAIEAMRICGEGLGDYLDCLPDGETGTRRIWINYLAATTYDGNPALETINRPAPVDVKHPEEFGRLEQRHHFRRHLREPQRALRALNGRQ